MGSGYQVNHAELTDTASKTDDAGSDAQGIVSKVSAANGTVPQNSWGLLGEMGPYEIYKNYYGEFSQHVGDIVSGIQKLATNIKNTADQYKQNEDEVNEKFTDIEKDLDGTAKPPETNGGDGGGDSSGSEGA